MFTEGEAVEPKKQMNSDVKSKLFPEDLVKLDIANGSEKSFSSRSNTNSKHDYHTAPLLFEETVTSVQQEARENTNTDDRDDLIYFEEKMELSNSCMFKEKNLENFETSKNSKDPQKSQKTLEISQKDVLLEKREKGDKTEISKTEPKNAEKKTQEETIGELKRPKIAPKIQNLKSTSVASKTPWAIHEPIRDSSAEYDALPEKALKFGFELDDFQKQAILHLEKGESVFVSAHTSAGKTVIAEYAIALSISHLTRAIYTSPIKTLSNQKFRDFKKTFGQVGIITGDISINPDANCLILTTEIFRTLLHKGSDIVSEIEWIIFDEVHYINDYERGVVWEEVIIMLPPHINIIMLSATVPNSLEFANWVGRTKKKRIHVISTLKRPVPLKHILWLKNKSFKLIEGETYNKECFESAYRYMNSYKKESLVDIGYYKELRMRLFSLTHMLQSKELMPAVFFIFSKNKCNSYAKIISGRSLNNKSERFQVKKLIERAFKRLSIIDQNLPQIIEMRVQLENGIGVHHSGKLPIVKEIVEMCFSRGLVKILFATETFAVGVNMPARTVIFDDLVKHDGRCLRVLTSAEYIQMSGRAGRRGIDTFGNVIVVATETLFKRRLQVEQMLNSSAACLVSKFQVKYNMILNLLKSEDLNVRDVIYMSFNHYHKSSELDSKIEFLEETSERIQKVINEKGEKKSERLEKYIEIIFELSSRLKRILDLVSEMGLAHLYICPGRMIMIRNPKSPHLAKGIIIKVKKHAELSILAIIFVPKEWKFAEKNLDFNSGLKRFGLIKAFGNDEQFIISEVYSSDVFCLCREKIKICKSKMSRGTKMEDKTIRKIFIALTKTKNPESRIKEYRKLINHKESEIEGLFAEAVELEERLGGFEFHRNLNLIEDQFESCSENVELRSQINDLNYMKTDDGIFLVSVFEKKIKVLMELGFIDKNRSVLIKGNVSRELNTVESLILTEVIFNSTFKDLSPENILAALSCLVYSGPKRDLFLRKKHSLAFDALREAAENIGLLQEKVGLGIKKEDYIEENLNNSLMEVVYHWALGKRFRDICKLTQVEEGNIVRHIVRLNETCLHLKTAARVMGDPDLHRKMEEASALIKRDIVFTPSLYLM